MGGARSPQMFLLLLLAVDSEGQGPKQPCTQKPVPPSNCSSGSDPLLPTLLLPCFQGPVLPGWGLWIQDKLKSLQFLLHLYLGPLLCCERDPSLICWEREVSAINFKDPSLICWERKCLQEAETSSRRPRRQCAGYPLGADQ